MMKKTVFAASLAISLTAGFYSALMTASPAAAGCISGNVCSQNGPIPYPVLYDATCGDLWYLRNSAYADNGYCFRSARGRRAFSNRGCSVERADDLRMSRIERTNIARIREVERKRGCR